MQTLGTALIGCGKVADAHAQAYQSLPESHFVGVYDINYERACALAKRYNVHPYQNLEEMLHDPAVQAASICSPHTSHPDMVAAFALARVHAPGGKTPGGSRCGMR